MEEAGERTQSQRRKVLHTEEDCLQERQPSLVPCPSCSSAAWSWAPVSSIPHTPLHFAEWAREQGTTLGLEPSSWIWPDGPY